MNDYYHTWTFDRDSRFIRTYLWLWAGEENNINFCKLFWGTLFAPLALIGHAVASVAVGLGILGLAIRKRLPGRFLHFPERSYIDRVESELEKPPNKFQSFLTAVSEVADRVAAFWQRHDGIGVGLLLVLGTVGLYGAVIGISIVLVDGNVFDIAELFWLPSWYWFLFHKKKEKVDRLDSKEKRKTPFRFLATGYWAVKHRSCPRVVIRDENMA